MTILVPIMLFGCVPLTVILFLTLKPHHAVLVSVIGAWLLMPQISYDLPGLPDYSKSTAIALGLILGGRLSGQRQKASFEWKLYDLPMILWCLCPIATSLTNQLGLYDGLAASFSQVMIWGIPYLTGRVYFNNNKTLQDLCIGIIVGGLFYVPLCLYEIRMSPQLSNFFYGFFPHSFSQHFRYGGWRPIVFMQHGLMVSLWLGVSSIIAFWFWRSRDIKDLKGILTIPFIVAALVITCVLCKSANGWFTLVIGCGYYFIHRYSKTRIPFLLLLIIAPLYISLRSIGFISADTVVTVSAYIFDAERIQSLTFRLLGEDLYAIKALEHPLLGWGGYNRAIPVDPRTGYLLTAIDSLWLIVFSSNGYFGLVVLYSAMLTGPWLVFRSAMNKFKGSGFSKGVPILLSLVVSLYMIDSLFNGMVNPIYIVISGALISWYVTHNQINDGHQF